MPRRLSPSAAGFTLIELLVVIGIVGLLATITIIAINPAKQLSDAEDAERLLSARAIENAITQYIIDEWDGTALTSQEVEAVEGVSNAIPICRQDAVLLEETNTCLSLSFLTPTYLVSIPTDPNFVHETHSGYCTYLTSSRYRVVSVYLLPDGGACSGDEELLMEDGGGESDGEGDDQLGGDGEEVLMSSASSAVASAVASSVSSPAPISSSSSESSLSPEEPVDEGIPIIPGHSSSASSASFSSQSSSLSSSQGGGPSLGDF